MELGEFSISLTVKDIEASRRFYVLKNGDTRSSFFKGCLRRTFSPSTPGGTTTLRRLSLSPTSAICSQLNAQEVQLQQQADESTTCRPASSLWTLMETRSSSISMCEQDGSGREIGCGGRSAAGQ
jgi:hypothetical protein